MPEVTLTGSSGGDMADLSDARCELLLSESLQNHASLMHTTRGNEQSAMNIGRHSSVRKFDKEDPIEAACVETILRLSK